MSEVLLYCVRMRGPGLAKREREREGEREADRHFEPLWERTREGEDERKRQGDRERNTERERERQRQSGVVLEVLGGASDVSKFSYRGASLMRNTQSPRITMST